MTINMLIVMMAALNIWESRIEVVFIRTTIELWDSKPHQFGHLNHLESMGSFLMGTSRKTSEMNGNAGVDLTIRKNWI